MALPFLGIEDERSATIGRRAGLLAYMTLSALLLMMVVEQLVTGGISTIGAVRFELAAFLLGWLVYFGTGLYYTRTM